MGFDNFEDYDFSACADNHFKFRSFSASVNATQSHTGNRSIKVSHGTAVNMTKQIAPCTITPACNLGLTDTYDSDAGTHCISVSGGTAPYAFDWQVINCDLGVTIDNAGDKICTGVSSGCSIRVTVTDRNNCTITKTFSLAAD